MNAVMKGFCIVYESVKSLCVLSKLSILLRKKNILTELDTITRCQIFEKVLNLSKQASYLVKIFQFSFLVIKKNKVLKFS